jgi:hypothetical protein
MLCFATTLLYGLARSLVKSGACIFFIVVCYTEAYPLLHRRPPKISLLALTPILSILLTLLINVAAQVTVFVWVTKQPW